MNLRFVEEHVEGTALVEAMSNEIGLEKQWHEKLQQQNSTCCLIFVSEHMALRGTGILLDLTILPLPTLVPLRNSNYYIYMYIYIYISYEVYCLHGFYFYNILSYSFCSIF